MSNSSKNSSRHILHDYIINPPHRITVTIIGCGGTGSQVLSIVARMHISLLALGHPGFSVTVYDHDTVSEANYGRQLFTMNDIGLNKAVVSVTRINRAYGLDWKAVPAKATKLNGNIIISCVDKIASRREINNGIAHNRQSESNNNREDSCFYWLDFGNGYDTGQAILGSYGNESVKLLDFFDIYPELKKGFVKNDNTEDSCSLAQALGKQDLLVNPLIANLGMGLLWRLFREGTTEYNGVILNLKSFESTSIKIKSTKNDTATAKKQVPR